MYSDGRDKIHPQTTGSDHDALQTNLAQCAKANLTMQLVTSSPAHSSTAMVVGRKVFLQKFVHTRNNSSFLAMKNKPSCRPDCSRSGRLRMLPALGSGWQPSWWHLCQAGDVGALRRGETLHLSYDTVGSCGVGAPVKLGLFYWLWLRVPQLCLSLRLGCSEHCAPESLQTPVLKLGVSHPPGCPDNLFWLFPGSIVPGSDVTMAGTRFGTKRSCRACWLGRSSSWGAGIGPGSDPRRPPSHSPTAQVAPAEADG